MTEKPFEEAKLKNGQKVAYAKIEDRNYFISVAMQRNQVVLLIFIVILSILLSYGQMQYTMEGMSTILKEVQEIHNIVAIDMNSSFFSVNPYNNETLSIYT